MPNAAANSASYTPRPSVATKPRSGEAPIAIAACCFIIVAALVGGVGIPDGLVLRHVVQTLPLWVAIILGLVRYRATGWVALPFFIFWLALMSLIWLYLLGIATFVSGHFSPLEIAMTIIVGIASVVGLAVRVRFKSGMPPLAATILFITFAVIQLACFRASLLPSIANR